MTKKTTAERLAVMENKIDDVKDEVHELKVTVKNFITVADDKYLSRKEAAVAGKAVGIVLTIVGLVFAAFSAF